MDRRAGLLTVRGRPVGLGRWKLLDFLPVGANVFVPSFQNPSTEGRRRRRGVEGEGCRSDREAAAAAAGRAGGETGRGRTRRVWTWWRPGGGGRKGSSRSGRTRGETVCPGSGGNWPLPPQALICRDLTSADSMRPGFHHNSCMMRYLIIFCLYPIGVVLFFPFFLSENFGVG